MFNIELNLKQEILYTNKVSTFLNSILNIGYEYLDYLYRVQQGCRVYALTFDEEKFSILYCQLQTINLDDSWIGTLSFLWLCVSRLIYNGKIFWKDSSLLSWISQAIPISSSLNNFPGFPKNGF